jgi:hypothetical protein
LNMALSHDQRPSRPTFDARASVVNRTRRVVRERAAAVQARKRTVRDLIVPFLICSALLLLIANAVWSVAEDGLAEWESGIWKRVLELGSDTGNSVSILLVWFLPLSVITAAIILLRRTRGTGHDDEARRR